MQSKIVIEEGKLIQNFTEEQKELKQVTFKKLVQLLKEKNFSEMIALLQSPLKILPQEVLGEGDKEMSEIYFLYASALKETSTNSEVIKKYAVKSFHFNRMNKNALWLIRELDNIADTETKLFRLQIIGKMYRMFRDEEIKDIFRTIYTVAANNEVIALDYIKKSERAEIAQDLEIIKTFDLGLRADLPQGIYETMKLMLWVDGEK